MNKTVFKNLFKINQKLLQNRFYCYKTVRRVPSNSLPLKAKVTNATPQDKPTISVASQLTAQIKATGPITISEYMKQVLTNPSGGYYMLKDVFGEKGDFITSPEITQIFGELVAIWCLTEWRKIGKPSPLQIVEFGPGRGTLSQDLLRVFSHFGEQKQVSLHLVEVSPYLAKLQSQKLCYKSSDVDSNTAEGVSHYRQGESISGIQIFWYHRIEDVPKRFSIYLAHEFFDALPIHKLQKVDNNKWREILIDIDEKEKNKFRYIIAKDKTPISSYFKGIPNDTRDHIEFSLETEKIMHDLAARLESYGGFGLIIDYGHFGEKGDTFRSFKNHKLHDPLVEPGTADVTADVDFKQMKYFAEKDKKLITFGPINQGDFLKRMGGDIRLETLLESATTTDEQKEQLKSGYEMLTHPNKMGECFKFFAIYPSVLEEIHKHYPVTGFV